MDLTPIDPHRDKNRLLSYIWPDQQHRLALTQAAIDIADQVPASIHAADAVEWLEHRLELVPSTVTLVFHTIAWQYVPEARRAQGDARLATLGQSATQSAPLARFAMEAAGPHAALTLQVWPGGGIIPLGRADYHGRRISWDVPELESAQHGP